MYLTNKRLVFMPHSVNVQRGTSSHPLMNITQIFISGLLRNELRVQANNTEERFVVFRPKGWKHDILRAAGL